MEINMLEAKKAFKEYVKDYNPDDKQIMLKIRHIERVTDVAKKTAEFLKLNEEDIKLAELIALLHDIGRFEQVKRYKTFFDKISINHAELGVSILFNDGLIRNFIKTNEYDEIIKKAILNHNKAEIEDGLNERELLHAKIIRDSDKTDIFYALTTEPIEAIFRKTDISKELISDKIYKDFMENKIIKLEDITSCADNVVVHFAFVYNFYFEYVKQIMKKEKYLEKYYNRFKFEDEVTQERLYNVYKLAKDYIEKL